MHESVQSILAPHFIGVVVNSLFYGITLAQTRTYYCTYKDDPMYMKILVAILWLLDTVQFWLVLWSIYEYTIIGKGNLEILAHVTRSFQISMAVTSVVAFMVQMIYAFRIWNLSFHNAALTGTIVLLAVIALGSGGAMAIKTIRDPRWDHTSVNDAQLPASLILVSTVACDAVIAGSQVIFFHRSRSIYGRLGNLITRLTVLVVNVGLLTSIDVTIFLILFLACPLNGIFLVPFLLLSNCYLNSFLSVLNCRKVLRELAINDDYGTPTLRPDNPEPPDVPPDSSV